MTDIVPGLPILIACGIWLGLERDGRNTLLTSFLVGLLAGLSVGLKLTQLSLFVGLSLAICARQVAGKKLALLEAFAFGCAGVAVFAAVDGAWLIGNYRNYGNPIFPYMNNIFRSDLIAPSPWTDLHGMPKTPLMAVFYPLYWGLWLSHDTIELNMRDLRIFLGCAGALTILCVGLFNALKKQTGGSGSSIDSIAVPLAIAYLISYVFWERLWSLYRYLAIQETLSGVIVLAALVTLFKDRRRTPLVAGAFVLIAAIVMLSTSYPWWSRTSPGEQAVSVALAPIEGNAMVLFLDPYAYSYLVPFMPATTRALGINSNLVRPELPGTLTLQVAKAVAEHNGPLWGMENPQAYSGWADTALTAHHLARGDCSMLQSNIEVGPIVKICRLHRL